MRRQETALKEARNIAPDMDWEIEGEHVVGVRDAFTPRELVIKLGFGQLHGRPVWTAWLRSAVERGSCNFTLSRDGVAEVLGAVRDQYKKERR